MNHLRKIIYTLLIVALNVSVVCAREISEAKAREIAAGFYASVSGGNSPLSLRSADVGPDSHADSLYRHIYAFTMGENQGFVLVSGDDRAKPVLAYSLSGSFSFDDMPVQLRGLLEAYSLQLSCLERQDEKTPAYGGSYAETRLRSLRAGKAKAPLLDGIVWNQDAPFNNLCPEDRYVGQRTPAGCVAIAAAQIMRYYRYPEHGVGGREYSTETQRIPVRADFENTVYDWDNMLENYNGGNYSLKQAEAVATLVYHVGVACKMDYDYMGSGATAKETARIFTKYFNYDSNLEYIDRTHYTEPEWEALLKSEIDAGRPVLQLGEGPSGGHAFVCDGYDENGFFHYNWGWGGLSDGYYQSSALDPEVLGIGSGMGSYNYLQSAFCNIQPPCDSSVHVAGVHLARTPEISQNTTARNEGNTVRASFYNYGLRDFSGEVVAALYNPQGEMLCVLAVKNLKKLTEMTGGTSGSDFTFTIPAEIPDGRYALRFAHKENGTDAYVQMLAPVTQRNYLDVVITQDNVSYLSHKEKARLSLMEKPKILTPLYQGCRASFSVSVRNDGEEYYSYMGVLLQKKNTYPQVRQYVGVMLTRIPKGAVRTFTYTTDSLALPAGDYDVVAVCDFENAQQSYLDAIGPDNLMVTDANLLAQPEDGRFLLTAPISVIAEDGGLYIYPNQYFNINAEICNEGGYDDADFLVVFFNRAEEMVGNTNPVGVSLGRGEKKSLQFSYRLNTLSGQYAAVLATVNNESVATPVEPVDYCSTVFKLAMPLSFALPDQEEALRAYVQGDKLCVSAAGNIDLLSVYDAQGRQITVLAPQTQNTELPVHTWRSGVYLLRVSCGQGNQTLRVMIP